VPVPWSNHPMGFYLVGLLSLALTAVATVILWKKRLF